MDTNCSHRFRVPLVQHTANSCARAYAVDVSMPLSIASNTSARGGSHGLRLFFFGSTASRSSQALRALSKRSPASIGASF
eukprot:scaffold32939_cov30-Tisochrysis_lutea.AAC.3